MYGMVVSADIACEFEDRLEESGIDYGVWNIEDCLLGSPPPDPEYTFEHKSQFDEAQSELEQMRTSSSGTLRWTVQKLQGALRCCRKFLFRTL